MRNSPHEQARSESEREADGAASVRGYRTPALALLSDLVLLWSSEAFQRSVFESATGVADPLPMNFLYRLAVRGPLKPSQLAAELATGRSNISKVTARLEDSGLIARTSDPDDRRGVLVALTPDGQAVAQRLFDAGDRMVADIVADWGPERMADFTTLLSGFVTRARDYSERLSRSAADPPPAPPGLRSPAQPERTP
ncbi:MarR family winged helix-turn-helix transcriptional regulator [Streptomyces fuscichromogenes]|uniref:MarR family winged helix-turn-helix transcriptional regulator n=1 Tax=Streptomyces fuscichromogenes TaxID=1324013 RepID=UPI0038052CB2